MSPGFFLTLVASDKPLTPGHLAGIERYLDSQGLTMTAAPAWLAPHKAADFTLADHPTRAQMQTIREALTTDWIDVFAGPQAQRRKKLMLADMDATIVTTETLDELAARVGIGAEIKAITARSMNGEIDFPDALRARVEKLRGVPQSLLQGVLDDTILSPGAEILLQVLNRKGVRSVLVSGGFTFYTEAVARRAGFDHHYGNILEIENGLLTGRVKEPILDRDAKLKTLQREAAAHNVSLTETLTIGDGANDLDMLQAAGLGIGYRPKKVVADALDNLLLYGDLTAALYAQGYKESEIRSVFN